MKKKILLLLPIVTAPLTLSSASSTKSNPQSRFFYALQENDFSAVKKALEEGANPNIAFYVPEHYNDFMPFEIACFNNDKNLAALLLEHSADPLLTPSKKENNKPRKDNNQIFNILSRPAELGQKAPLVKMVFDYMTEKKMFPFSRLEVTLKNEQSHLVPIEYSPLHLAALYSFEAATEDYCLDLYKPAHEQPSYRIDPNTKNSQNLTPLFLCVRNTHAYGKEEAITTLLERGADPLEECEGSTPLAIARIDTNYKLVTQLLQRIAEPSYSNPAAIRHLNEKYKGACCSSFQEGDNFLHFVASECCRSKTIMAGLLAKYAKKPTPK